jgi:hypothetical protein
MSVGPDHRLKVLEQQFQVMQKEVNEVLGEMQQALTALMRAQAMASQVIDARLTEIEKKSGIKDSDGKYLPEDTGQDHEGKEL